MRFANTRFVNPFESRAKGQAPPPEPLRIKVNQVEVNTGYDAEFATSSSEGGSIEPIKDLEVYLMTPSVIGGTVAKKRAVEAFSHDYEDPSHMEQEPFVHPSSENALMAAAHMAFMQHLPLALYPDTLWSCILKGVAHHVFTYVPSGEGNPVTGVGEKIPLVVRTDSILLNPGRWKGGRKAVKGTQNWAGVIDTWCSMIQEHIGSRLPKVSDAMNVRFSTSTQITATAFNVAFMSAFRKYFEYIVDCICGIPYVELHGTKEDWEQMIRALDMLDDIHRITDYGQAPDQHTTSTSDKGSEEGYRSSDKGSEDSQCPQDSDSEEGSLSYGPIDVLAWKRELQGVLHHFVAAYEQNAEEDNAFWSRIFKHFEEANIYEDHERVSGWLCKFVPYTKEGRVNPLAQGSLPEYAGKRSKAVEVENFGSALSEAPATLRTSGCEYPLVIISGLCGVRQNLDSGVLRPEVGWLVAREEGRGYSSKGPSTRGLEEVHI